jgi:hypothetical protein
VAEGFESRSEGAPPPREGIHVTRDLRALDALCRALVAGVELPPAGPHHPA